MPISPLNGIIGNYNKAATSAQNNNMMCTGIFSDDHGGSQDQQQFLNTHNWGDQN